VPVFSNKRTAFLLAIIIGVLIWNHNRPPDKEPTQQSPQQLPKVTASPPPALTETSPTASTENPVAPDTAKAAAPNAVLPMPAAASPSAARVLPGSVNEIPVAPEVVTEELSAVDSTIRNYQAVHGENPVGSNAEITSALLGNNPKQIKLEVPAGSQVNGEGELCDRWGTPYFFHQLSATEMEIRTAGPDRQMWTGDDSQM
jgi:hypothetical protein